MDIIFIGKEMYMKLLLEMMDQEKKIGIYYYLILNMIMFKINQNRQIILNCFLIAIIKEI